MRPRKTQRWRHFNMFRAIKNKKKQQIDGSTEKIAATNQTGHTAASSSQSVDGISNKKSVYILGD